MDGHSTVIHPLSGVTPLPQFELWSVPGTQVSVAKDIVQEVRPFSTLSSGQPIEFLVQSAVDEYINLSETYLSLRMKVELTRKDKPTLLEGDWGKIQLTKNFFHGLFSHVELKIGDKQITANPQNYHYRAFIDTLFGFTEDAKHSHLHNVFWDPSGKERYYRRGPRDLSSEGPTFELMGRLHTDLTFQEKLLLGGCDLSVRLIPNKNAIIFHSDETPGLQPAIKIMSANLLVRKSKVFPSLASAHAEALRTAPARYPITRVEVKHQTIPAGMLDVSLNNVIRGQIPRRMFVAFIDNDIFNGDFSNRLYSFHHHDVNYLAAFVDGVQYPSQPFLPSFSEDLYMREFNELFVALNQNRTDSYMRISYESFESPYCIFPFNLSPDLSNGPSLSGHVSPIKHGSLRLDLRFAKAPTKPLNVLMYCEFDNMIEIDENRQAKTDYN